MWRFKYKLRGNVGSIMETFQTENEGMKRYDELIQEGIELDGFEIDVIFSEIDKNTAFGASDTALSRLLSKGMNEYDYSSFGPSDDEVKLASMLGLELMKPTYH